MELLGWEILLLGWKTLILRKFKISGKFYSFWGISPPCFNLPQNITVQNHLRTSVFPKLPSMMLWVQKIKKTSHILIFFEISLQFSQNSPFLSIKLNKSSQSVFQPCTHPKNQCCTEFVHKICFFFIQAILKFTILIAFTKKCEFYCTW